jgi:monooxygenase
MTDALFLSFKRFARRGLTAALVVVGAAAVVAVLWSACADAVLTRPATPPRGDPGQFTTVDGVRAYYRVRGSGPALVLLHGLGSSHLTWSAVEDAFAQRFTVYELDLPGFGYSDKPFLYTSARQEAAFVDDFLGSLGVERATVIGHSMGGDVALWLAVEHPERVDRLVLVNIAEVGEAAAVFRVAATPVLGDVFLKTTTTPLTLGAMLANPYVQKQMVTPRLADEYARIYWTPGARRALIDLARSYEVDRAALRAEIPSVHAPVLIVWTDADPYFPVSVARDLHDLLPTAEVEVIHDAGHLPQEEQPETFESVVLARLH